jgi:hypothetical protein
MSGMSEMGGKETTRVFSTVQKFKIFFFGADVEDATSARDGRWTDAKNYSRVMDKAAEDLDFRLELLFVSDTIDVGRQD